ncbi:MAG: recombination-associated protein RdgC [Betaproteobacteria bacterium]|nr:recombination-associated protein RdgC [Betaproteobacteria bacterium]
MWFRNLQLYRIDTGVSLDAEDIQKRMLRFAFQPCTSLMPESHGWIPPRGDERLLYTLNRQWLVALGVEQKLLPASVVKQEVQRLATEQEARTGLKPSRKRLRDMKDEVTDTLLARAFSRYRSTFCWMDPESRWLVVDAATPKKADELNEWLRKSVDEITFAPIATRITPTSGMTQWLMTHEPPPGMTIDRECVLQSTQDEKATVRYTNHPLLDTQEIRNHITAGKAPIRLALTWQDRISFALTDKFEIKKLQFLDLVREEGGGEGESDEEQFEGDFAMMTGMLLHFLGDLVEALGGEAAD